MEYVCVLMLDDANRHIQSTLREGTKWSISSYGMLCFIIISISDTYLNLYQVIEDWNIIQEKGMFFVILDSVFVIYRLKPQNRSLRVFV